MMDVLPRTIRHDENGRMNMELFKQRMTYAIILAVLAATIGVRHAFFAGAAPNGRGAGNLRRSYAGEVDPGKLSGFLAAAEAGNFAAMRRQGMLLFTEDVKIPDAKEALARYVTASQPPYTVYRFHAEDLPDKTRRVLLTLDGRNRVVSFIAEEMAVAE